MKKSNLNYIADGINKPDKGKSFLRIIQIVTIVAIALGCVSVLIPLAVLDGFHNELRAKATVFSSHISIKDFNDSPILNPSKIKSIINHSQQIAIYDPIIKKNALLKTKDMAEGIVVKGIETYRTKKLFEEFIIEGQYKFSSIKANEIILSQDIAKKNNLTIGSKVFLYSLSKDDIINNKLPNIEAFKIKAIFNTGFAQYDNSVCFIPKEKAAEFFKMEKNSCSQIDLYLKDLEKTESFSAEIDNKLGYPFYTVNIFNLHSSIFNWIEFQREPIPIILGLISLVAVFNIVSILLITIIEKIQTIGILKSLGMSNFDIRFIFIRQGLKTAIYGIIFGCGFALALLLAQKEFSIIKLDPEIYYLDKVPVTIELWHYPLVIIVVLLMTLFASLIPSVIASKITPTRAMRFR